MSEIFQELINLAISTRKWAVQAEWAVQVKWAALQALLAHLRVEFQAFFLFNLATRKKMALKMRLREQGFSWTEAQWGPPTRTPQKGPLKDKMYAYIHMRTR